MTQVQLSLRYMHSAQLHSHCKPHSVRFTVFVTPFCAALTKMPDTCLPQCWAYVEYLDEVLGTLFNFLESSSLRKNTVIMLTSDNGPDEHINPGQDLVSMSDVASGFSLSLSLLLVVMPFFKNPF